MGMEDQKSAAQVAPTIEVPSQRNDIPQSTPASPLANINDFQTVKISYQIILLEEAGEGWGCCARQQHLCAEQRRRRSQSTSSWAQRAFMQTFTIVVIDSPAGGVGVDLSSKACLPLPDLASDISGIVYHDQHQQIRFLYQGRLRWCSILLCSADRPSTTIIQGVILIMSNRMLVVDSFRFQKSHALPQKSLQFPGHSGSRRIVSRQMYLPPSPPPKRANPSPE
ncbi:hypothetical protein BHYA_0076g00130 [Botrytis hyacinthi]|uniref:Uncharacterized protein n=1 Tax=Botrytis hyacinthi TaxID=278943 RepID=A0A4Z1GSC6_9HELO|nr:hypothetical protein BHYA_0076g00130 [Botrytis hyacinthi]